MKKYTNQIIIVLSLMGIALSGYLWWFQVTPSIIPCTDDGCANVLNSQYGKLFGVPMSVYGFFFYATVALFAFLRMEISHKLLDKILLLLIIAGILFTIYLRYLEFFVIGDICTWCWGSVVIILLILLSYICGMKKTKKK